MGQELRDVDFLKGARKKQGQQQEVGALQPC
jgi:hypothetical protein